MLSFKKLFRSFTSGSSRDPLLRADGLVARKHFSEAAHFYRIAAKENPSQAVEIAEKLLRIGHDTAAFRVLKKAEAANIYKDLYERSTLNHYLGLACHGRAGNHFSPRRRRWQRESERYFEARLDGFILEDVESTRGL